MRRRTLWGWALVLAGLLACAGARAEGLNVVATIFPPYDFARTVAQGTGAEVSMLLRPGVESHAYDPSPADIVKMEGCDLFLYIGGENDAWVEEILSSMGEKRPVALRLMDCVEVLPEETGEGMEAEADGEMDQHIWTSPRNARKMVQAIAQALCEADPVNETTYRANLASFDAELEILDADFAGVAQSGARREMVFADRFPFLYFAKDYGIEWYAAFPGCSSESEPSAATIAFLIDKIKADHLPVIYRLEQGNERVASILAQETGAKVLRFHACHNVTKDDMETGRTYLDFMKENVEALRAGLN